MSPIRVMPIMSILRYCVCIILSKVVIIYNHNLKIKAAGLHKFQGWIQNWFVNIKKFEVMYYSSDMYSTWVLLKILADPPGLC